MLFRDTQYALRSFLKTPAFTILAVLTLALGIAANTTVFSWVDTLLLRPFPGATDADRLAIVHTIQSGAPNGGNALSYFDWLDYRSSLKSISGLAVHSDVVFSVGEAPRAEALWGESVSADYFTVLGIRAAHGRTFTTDDAAVVVISDGLFQRRFQRSPKAIGATLRVNQHELTIIGVTPREFRGTMPGLIFDIWTPLSIAPMLGIQDLPAMQSRNNRWLYGLARLAPGHSIEQARAEAIVLARALEQTFPRTNRGVSMVVAPVWEFPSNAPGLLLKPLRILMGIALLLLLIVCANVANLLLARTLARRKELSIRLAVGAQSTHIARQLFTETVILSIAASGIGILLAAWMADVLPSLVPNVGVRVALGFSVSWRVLAFTGITCLVAATVAGLLPAVWWMRGTITQSRFQHNRARGLLVVFEVAVATLAVVSAGLFVRSFQRAHSIDPGFDRNNLVLARFYLASTGFNADQVQQFGLRLRDQLRSTPGVVNVAYADYAPLGTDAGPYNEIEVQGYTPQPKESMQVNRYRVSPGYFDVMRTSLVEGRDFMETDDAAAPPVIVVNQTFARRYFGGGSALGRHVKIGRAVTTVIGVVRDSKYFDVAEASRPHFFVPIRQRGPAGGQLYFFVRAAISQASAISVLRRDVAAVDSRAAAFDAMPFSEWSDVTLLPHKVAATLAGGLALIALLVAAVGLYSVMAYAVSQRTQEIGIRMALGARPLDVLGDVLLRGLALTAVGLAAGTAVALAVTRVVSSMLIQVSATDPATFGGTALFLISVAAIASYLPARRATHVDPIEALRRE
jgi:predicted permease